MVRNVPDVKSVQRAGLFSTDSEVIPQLPPSALAPLHSRPHDWSSSRYCHPDLFPPFKKHEKYDIKKHPLSFCRPAMKDEASAVVTDERTHEPVSVMDIDITRVSP